MYRTENYNWEECTGDRHYKWKECTGTDITSERNVQGQTLQVRGMYSGQRLHVRGIGDRHYKWEDSTGDRQTDIMWTESGQILHVREIYRKWMSQVKGSYRGQMQMEITLMDITSQCLLSSSQDPSKCLFKKLWCRTVMVFSRFIIFSGAHV